jgi:hypothetical protein
MEDIAPVSALLTVLIVTPCLQRHLQTSPPTPQKSYPKLWKLSTIVKIPAYWHRAMGRRGPQMWRGWKRSMNNFKDPMPRSQDMMENKKGKDTLDTSLIHTTKELTEFLRRLYVVCNCC